MNIVIATGNQGKFNEIVDFLSNVRFSFISLNQFNIPEPEESGLTFEENAILKSEYYSYHTNMSCLSDDSGLVIPSIDNQPGIYSARWAGENKDFSLAISRVYNKILQKGLFFESDIIKAFFYCAVSLKIPNKDPIVCSGKFDGFISSKPLGSCGFGYDPIFIPLNSNRTLGQYEYCEKLLDNHRVRALKKLKKLTKGCKKDTYSV